MDARQYALSSALDAALSGVRDPYARRLITEHLMKALRPTGKRKPPEAGIPMPAIPPTGPLPKQGGVEAPLDFSH
jgi:hypothetical protein